MKKLLFFSVFILATNVAAVRGQTNLCDGLPGTWYGLQTQATTGQVTSGTRVVSANINYTPKGNAIYLEITECATF